MLKISPKNRYSNMQRRYYSKVDNPMYGNDDVTSSYLPIRNMLKGFKGKALDFGCGLGRSITLYKNLQIDGADIAERYVEYCRDKFPKSKFFLTDGVSLNNIPNDCYDVVFFVAVLQHIPVYKIRFNLLKEMYRVLKIGGSMVGQMGFGYHPHAKNYYDNYWKAEATNSKVDVMIDSPKQIREDLKEIGFKNFKYKLVDKVNDSHDKWIMFGVVK